MFDFTNDFILKDSCPLRISTLILPFLVVLNLLFTIRVKFSFLVNEFFKIALIDFSFVIPNTLAK